jgi:hypothetical protein
MYLSKNLFSKTVFVFLALTAASVLKAAPSVYWDLDNPIIASYGLIEEGKARYGVVIDEETYQDYQIPPGPANVRVKLDTRTIASLTVSFSVKNNNRTSRMSIQFKGLTLLHRDDGTLQLRNTSGCGFVVHVDGQLIMIGRTQGAEPIDAWNITRQDLRK